LNAQLNVHLPISAAPSDVSGNGTQDAATPDKHKIELAAGSRTRTDMIRQQIILASGVAMAGTIPLRPGDVRAVVASRR
jgi:hypothetical protein